MEYGICNLAIVPLRALPAHSSEVVTQLLFGETFEITEWQENWAHVVCSLDGYEGWVHYLQFAMLNHELFQSVLGTPKTLTSAFVTAALRQADNSILYLPFNSILPLFDGINCYIGDDTYVMDIGGNFSTAKCATGDDEYFVDPGDDEVGFLAMANTFVNTPYLWGGRTHFGIDCSGFSQAVMRTKGISLRRDAWQQAEQGRAVDFMQEAHLGDLAFFDNEEGRITHVGIMLNNEKIIHASGKVKIDHIDGQGIYSTELKKYTHKLRIIKRYF